MGEKDGPTRPVPQLWMQNRITMMPIDTPTTASGAQNTQPSGNVHRSSSFGVLPGLSSALPQAVVFETATSCSGCHSLHHIRKKTSERNVRSDPTRTRHAHESDGWLQHTCEGCAPPDTVVRTCSP